MACTYKQHNRVENYVKTAQLLKLEIREFFLHILNAYALHNFTLKILKLRHVKRKI